MKNFTAKITLIAVTILLLAGERKAQAQTNNLTKPTREMEIIEANQKHDDTKKLIEILGLQNNAKTIFPKIINELKPQFPQVPNKFWDEFQSESNLQKCMDFYVRAYETHFTHEEIKGMIQFYSTPLGQKIVSTMPKVMQESMDMGKKMGVALKEQVEKQTSENNSVISTSRDDVKRRIILSYGLNPDEYDISDDGKNIISKPKPQPTLLPLPEIQETQQPSAPVPADVHYLVKYGEMMCYCKDEPKPYGNGFKFKMYPSDVETTVSGDIQIIKLKKDEK